MIIKCPECGKEVSDQASKCPGCGYRICNTRTVHLVFCILHFTFLFISFGIGLFITISLHIIYCIKQKSSQQDDSQQDKFELWINPRGEKTSPVIVITTIITGIIIYVIILFSP